MPGRHHTMTSFAAFSRSMMMDNWRPNLTQSAHASRYSLPPRTSLDAQAISSSAIISTNSSLVRLTFLTVIGRLGINSTSIVILCYFVLQAVTILVDLVLLADENPTFE